MERIKSAAQFIKECELENGNFSKVCLIQLIENMSAMDYNAFCKEILLLSHHYHTSIETSACDLEDFIADNPEKFYKHARIDLDAPTGFKAQL